MPGHSGIGERKVVGNMHLVPWSVSALDYEPCRYGASKLLFRGPKKTLSDPYVACVGSSETYGKFVRTPFAETLGHSLGCTSVNLGVHNAGLDAFLQDESAMSVAGRAGAVVVQVMGAAALSTQFYVVHPRRNDRFLQASPMMARLFPEVDFSEYSFIQHLLGDLRRQWPDRFSAVEQDIQSTWVTKMARLLTRLGPHCVLLWLADTPPPKRAEPSARPDFVTADMVAKVMPLAAEYVEVVTPQAFLPTRREGMHYLPHETAAADVMPGPQMHRYVADHLAPSVARVLQL